ncbi:MAG: sigma factor-like helix-turn-helix DNA-binding protein [Terrisporobacter othiniensis]|uniref:sigma factor-like helix-turn-helix DNA-binding protein n=1 Tax=Terrisporobacter othiniensis TaxID=1577792 RepID=UPI00291485CB|nr:sigma factor-like helix-turn-helix DNA-binding protein [Terrisporobacter othiniensis]MDU6983961.1 sigma factor-like helix-turn-helix DNA-binding protein [Terrisporobacter othiniensis]
MNIKLSNEKTLNDKLLNGKKILIKDFYEETGIITFIKYCDKNNFKYMDDLNNYDFNVSLGKIKGFGSKRIKILEERYKQYTQLKENLNLYLDSENPLIKYYFKENAFNMFVDYCTNNQMYYMKDLEGFDFDTLSKVKGFGVGKISKLKEKYSKFNKNGIQTIEKNLSSGINIPEINHDFYDLDIRFLRLYGISEKQLVVLKKKYNTIGDVLSYIKEEQKYPEEFAKVNITKFNELALVAMKEDIIYVVNNILNEIESHKYYQILQYRSINEETLETIGSRLSLSRERIRQIEKRVILDLEVYIFCLGLIMSRHQLDIGSIYISDENIKLIKYCINKLNSDEIICSDDNGLTIYIKDINIPKSLELDILKKDSINYENLTKYQSEYLNCVINKRFNARGKYLVRKNIKLLEIYKYIFENYFYDYIDKESEINEFNKILIEDFNIEQGSEEEYMRIILPQYDEIICKSYLPGQLTADMEKYICSSNYPVTTSELMMKFDLDIELKVHMELEHSRKAVKWDTNKYLAIKNIRLNKREGKTLKLIIENGLDKNNGAMTSKELFDNVKEHLNTALDKNNIKINYSLYSLTKEIYKYDYNFANKKIYYKSNNKESNHYLNSNVFEENIINEKLKSKNEDIETFKKAVKKDATLDDKVDIIKDLLCSKDEIINKDITDLCRAKGYNAVDIFKIFDRVLEDFIQIGENRYKRKVKKFNSIDMINYK